MDNTVQDVQLGILVWDNSCGWWEGRVVLDSGSAFALYIHTPSETDQSITENARQVLALMKDSEGTARHFAAGELLQTHNNAWSEGKPIAQDEFVKRLIPDAIQIFPDGDAEISFGDDDLFWGHSIGVRYRRGKFTEAVVQG